LETAAAAAFGVAMFWGSWRLISLLSALSLGQWGGLWGQAGVTLLRTLLATFLGSLWAVPLGVKIGSNPRLVKILGPLIQITASVPAPMLFPALLVVAFALGLGLNSASVILMMTATSWYILFNVIAGASQIPAEMHETWRLHGRGRVKRWKRFILPAIFPSLLVGWETAMGGAWNASILTEYFRLNDTVHTAYGLGAVINLATVQGDFAMLAGAVLVMVLIVVGINRLVWHRLYDVASRMTGG
jgi:NitT/TauT family transport system permease protein